MEIRPIRSDADYDTALVDIEQYFDREPAPGTPEADRFDVLAALIGAYERTHWPIEAPDAVTAIAEVMALRGYKQADLGRLLGSAPRASEIMNRKRLPTRDQARKLHEEWGVPAASLLATEKPLPTKVVAFRRVESINKERRYQNQGATGAAVLAQLEDQIVAIRQEAYDAGFAAAMQAVREFSRPAAAPAKPAARRGGRPAANAPAARKLRGSNAQLIAEVLRGWPAGMARPAEIRSALSDKGVSMAFTSLRHALDQLATRNEVASPDDGKTWHYVFGGERA